MKKIIVGDCFECNAANIHVVDLVDGIGRIIEATDWEELDGIKKILPTLHLPISEPWFSRILSGEKTEEYREITTYYRERLCPDAGHCMNHFDGEPPIPVAVSSPDDDNIVFAVFAWIPFKVIHLTNGYGHHRPQLWAHITEITIGRGNLDSGAPDHDVFIIKLGEVFHTKNLKVVN